MRLFRYSVGKTSHIVFCSFHDLKLHSSKHNCGVPKMRDNEIEHREALAALVDASSNIVFFTGAGISTESGIADFRSPGGIWSQIKPIQFQDFLADEDTRLEDWRRRFHFQEEFDAARINKGHEAIARVMESSKGLGLITQNIDGLHQRSGITSASIVEIHGNGTSASCLECKTDMPLQKAKAVFVEKSTAPRCESCGGLVKANVISFGQPMPRDKMVEAERLALGCDLMMVLGSSLVVQPAASLPLVAKNNGAKLIIINREQTPLDALADLVIHAPLGETLHFSLEKIDFS